MDSLKDRNGQHRSIWANMNKFLSFPSLLLEGNSSRWYTLLRALCKLPKQ